MAWLRMAAVLVHNLFRDHGELALENLALRQQFAIFHGKKKTVHPGISGWNRRQGQPELSQR